jgi:hypothetical protein
MMITLSNLHQASLQDVFNQVARHLLTQMEKAIVIVEDEPHCQYRTYSGLTCAVGCMITDEEYTPMFEGMTASEVIRSFECYGTTNKTATATKYFCDELQLVHDDHEPKNCYSELAYLANKHNLNMPVLEAPCRPT